VGGPAPHRAWGAPSPPTLPRKAARTARKRTCPRKRCDGEGYGRAPEGRRKGDGRATEGAPEVREIHRGPKDEKDKTHTSTPVFSRRRDLARSAKLPVPHTEGHWFDSQKKHLQKKKKKKKNRRVLDVHIRHAKCNIITELATRSTLLSTELQKLPRWLFRGVHAPQTRGRTLARAHEDYEKIRLRGLLRTRPPTNNELLKKAHARRLIESGRSPPLARTKKVLPARRSP
jgi:hypothetical protein